MSQHLREVKSINIRHWSLNLKQRNCFRMPRLPRDRWVHGVIEKNVVVRNRRIQIRAVSTRFYTLLTLKRHNGRRVKWRGSEEHIGIYGEPLMFLEIVPPHVSGESPETWGGNLICCIHVSFLLCQLLCGYMIFICASCSANLYVSVRYTCIRIYYIPVHCIHTHASMHMHIHLYSYNTYVLVG